MMYVAIPENIKKDCKFMNVEKTMLVCRCELGQPHGFVETSMTVLLSGIF